jgi:hypothetical protein
MRFSLFKIYEEGELRLPIGTTASLRETPDEEFREFPDDGVATVLLKSPGSKLDLRTFWDCCFSEGTSWPDSDEMVSCIESGLADGAMVFLHFDSVVDAEHCLRRLYELGAYADEWTILGDWAP